MTRCELRNLARLSHDAEQSFQDFWPTIKAAVDELEPWSLQRWRRLHDQLMQICLCGDLDGQFSPADDDRIDPWILDAADENKPHDTISEARYQGTLFRTSEQYR